MKTLRIYVENSVVGGFYDKEFRIPTRKLFELFRKGIYIPVVSDHVFYELQKGAPQRVITNLQTINYEHNEISSEMVALSQNYMAERIVTEKYRDDAFHIAIATVLDVDVLVSWNFKHIVNLNKIKLFNSVNLREGYGILDIRTPLEVIGDA